MATCKDCISFSRCKEMYEAFGVYIDFENSAVCKHFKNKADFVEVVRCNDCQYKEECWQKVDCEYSYKEIVYCSYGTRTPKERGGEK